MAKNCVRCVLNYMTVPQDGNRCVPKGVSHADINFDTEIQEEVRPLCLPLSVEHCSRPFLPSPEPASRAEALTCDTHVGRARVTIATWCPRVRPWWRTNECICNPEGPKDGKRTRLIRLQIFQRNVRIKNLIQIKKYQNVRLS